jgi:hypothetical protein
MKGVTQVSRELRGSKVSPVHRFAMTCALLILPVSAFAGVKVFDSPDHTLELGLRLQQRLEYETSTPAPGGQTDGRRDFMVRRARLKANGKMQGVTYGFEWKIDGTDQTGSTPTAAVENAWMQYPLNGTALELKAGLYDAPFSRDLLTSDSRQLAVDRGEASAVPSALGLADNVVGFEFLGKTKDAKFSYMLGLFDNRFIAAGQQDVPMLAGRLEYNMHTTKDVYQDAHFGTDKWCSIGVDGSYQAGIENPATGLDDSTHSAAGVDGMVDIPFMGNRLFVKGELNAIKVERSVGTTEYNSTVKMLGAGILFNDKVQPFIRFDQVRSDALAPRGGRRDITYVGVNWYERGHSLKIQGDVRMQAGTEDPVDGARLQAQIDF